MRARASLLTMPLADRTEFINVDLDLRSRRDLAPLLDAMEKSVVVLHQDRIGGTYRASLELLSMKQSRTLESCVRGFVRVVQRLGPVGRRAWNATSSRRFDVGVRAGWAPENMKLELSGEALRALADVGGELVLTVYPPERAESRAR